MQILSRKMRPAILKALFVPLFVAVLFGLAWGEPLSAQQVDIHGPAGSEDFGDEVLTLPNGNFIVVDPSYDEAGVKDVGAVYLYSGADLSLISVLKGGTKYDSVGSAGVTVLDSGHYLVRSPWWDNPSGPVRDVGAVTWCDGASGCTGLVTTGNSLIGGSADDKVGNLGVTALKNGYHVVRSSSWDNPSGPVENVGAVTWCDDAGGCNGLVTTANSLVGGTAWDGVGGSGVTALSNGNYVVRSSSWVNPNGPVEGVGAVTWCDGAGGCTGLVTAANSLVGGTDGDWVGYLDVAALSNGHYVVRSPWWSNPNGPVEKVGAVTWCDGASGCTGLVTATNSLFGGTDGDWVGGSGVTALSNGHYVVSSHQWDNPSRLVEDVGAVTWCDGTSGCTGLVTTGNSLIGGTAEDGVGQYGVTALSNGHYVVNSPAWDNPSGPVEKVGAVTWCDGAGGCTGLVTAANSLFGGTAWDRVGYSGVTALNNGHYVVGTASWNYPDGPVWEVGAVTWCDGASGCTGLVTTANSLVGGSSGDEVGDYGVTALNNGHYVVNSPSWSNPSGPAGSGGAVTWCHGASGCTGPVTTANSLVCTAVGNQIGEFGESGVTALSNGNYVVSSRDWINPSQPWTLVGAISYGDGNRGTTGAVTPANSVLVPSPNTILDWDFDAMGERLVVGQRNIVTVFPASIELDIEKAVSQGSASRGDTLTYTVVVSNSGSIDLSGGVISDTMPGGINWLVDSATLQPSTAGTLGSPPQLVGGLYITASTSVTLTYQVEVTGDPGIVTNTASVTATRHLTPVVDTATFRVNQLFGQEIFFPFVYR